MIEWCCLAFLVGLAAGLLWGRNKPKSREDWWKYGDEPPEYGD